ncbi:MAG: ATP-binding protein [Candidatus Cloacimonadales bacterium]|nr:ATP-binding protein [Candidatus Cloacimonadales bacterium]
MNKINRIILKNKKEEINHFNAILEEFGDNEKIPFRSNAEICLAVEEILMNIISYSHPDEDEHEIEVKWWLDEEYFYLEITDDGVEFDPLNLPEPDLNTSLEDRKIGGLGIHFVKKLMHDVKYRRENEKNILFLKKKVF